MKKKRLPVIARSEDTGSKIRVLVVDDDVSILTVLRTLLNREGFETVAVNDPLAGISLCEQETFSIALSDIVMQPIDGMAFLQRAKKISPSTQIIIMTGFATVETAIKSLKLGAFDYICKPFRIDELLQTVHRAVSYGSSLATGKIKENARKKAVLIKRHFHEVIGESQEMRGIYQEINRLTNASTPVHLEGESGTGKQLIARALHTASNRKDYPFLTLHCAVCPEHLMDATLFGSVQLSTEDDGEGKVGLPVVHKGLFELAKGGTLHLEQISALPLEFQEKLLHVIQKNHFSRMGSTRSFLLEVRIVADSIENLEACVQQRLFLKKLWHHLKCNQLKLPNLIERKGDIPLLIDHFLIQASQHEEKKLVIASKAKKAMDTYSWPGNVRELRNTIFRSAKGVKRNTIQLSNLPVPIRMCFYSGEKTSIFGYSDELDLRGVNLKRFLKLKEKQYIEEVLRRTNGDKVKAAQLLGINIEDFFNRYGAYI